MPLATIDGLFAQFFNWRCELSRELYLVHSWLSEQRIASGPVSEKIAHLLRKLEEERITVAIVAEFSRGKTELINAMFFAGYGRRLLPSGAGTTTMCPTEVMYDSAIAPGLRLLPIETRESSAGLHEFKQDWNGWTIIDFDIADADSIAEAGLRLSDTLMAPVATAERYGLYDPLTGRAPLVTRDGLIEIPRWRHAIFNLPHPLLKQGLVILDTPGLNAIGTEPELTLSTIPNAHVVLFVLGADTGVTRSDHEIWVDHITTAGIARGNCLVALNKIDTMWDDLRPAASIETDIAQQVTKTARILGIAPERIFPISAQKGLLARIQNNRELLDRSRILSLETALADELPLAHRNVVQHAFKAGVSDLLGRVQSDLESRKGNLRRQREDLTSLHGKNREFISHSAEEATRMKEAFDRVSNRFNRLQAIVARQGDALLAALDPDRLRKDIAATREKMLASLFSKGVVDSMKMFFAGARENLSSARRQSDEIFSLVTSIYQRFIEEHEFRQGVPGRLALENYFSQIGWLEEKLDQRFGSFLRVLTSGKSSYTKKYYDALASSVLQIHLLSYRDAEAWLNSLMQPLEKEVQLRREWLRQREADIAKAADEGNTFQQNTLDLDNEAQRLTRQQNKFDELHARLKKILPEDDNWWARGEAA